MLYWSFKPLFNVADRLDYLRCIFCLSMLKAYVAPCCFTQLIEENFLGKNLGEKNFGFSNFEKRKQFFSENESCLKLPELPTYLIGGSCHRPTTGRTTRRPKSTCYICFLRSDLGFCTHGLDLPETDSSGGKKQAQLYIIRTQFIKDGKAFYPFIGTVR